MTVRTNIKRFIGVVFFLFVATGALAACGGGNPPSTPASTSGGSSSANSGAPGGNAPATPAAGNRPDLISGTITQYDTSAKKLTLKESNGTTATFSTGNAMMLKSQKITQGQLGSLLGNNGTIVMVMGQQAGTGTYTAQTLVVGDRANGNGNGAPQPMGTPPAGGNGGAPQPMGTPPAGGNNVIVQNGTLQNNQLVGKDQAGKAITVTLSGTTTIFQQTPATANDLQTGQTVTVVGGPAQGGSVIDARQILIGDSAGM